MSRDVPARGEKFIWTPGNNLDRVYMAVKTPMINGKRPRVTFHCYTWFAHWTKTMAFPLIKTIQPYEWSQQEVFRDRSGVQEESRPSGANT